MKPSSLRATATEIREIVGPLDDELVLEIFKTEATAAEVLEGFTWANADDQIGTETERGPRGTVGRVREILKRAEPDLDER